jgi:ankyrin repeat protein
MSIELIGLYNWLHGEIVEPLAYFAKLANQRMVDETRKSLIREARSKHFSQGNSPKASSPDIKPSSSIGPDQERLIADTFQTEDYNQVFDFLSFCEKFLQGRDSASFCILALRYLIESESLVFSKKQEIKVEALFAQLMGLDEKQALYLYEKHPSNFAKNFPETTKKLVNDRKQQRAIQAEVERLDDLLLHEINLLGIIPLFRDLFRKKPFGVNELAALVLFLLKNRVTAEQLIQSGILHDWLVSNSPYLGLPDNEVKQLYVILGKFSDADALIKQASHSGIQISSNYKIKNLLLNGEISKESVSDVAIIDTPFTFTVTMDNFKNLHTLFENGFLVEALKLFATNQDNALKELLISCINGKEDGGFTLQKISDLIQAARDRPDLLESLAAIIDDEIIRKLLQAGQGAIFHLTPYKPVILNTLETLEKMNSLQASLSDLIKDDCNPYDTIGQLIVLLKQCNKNANIEKLLYSEILNFVMKNPSVQEGGVVMNVLKSYMPKYEEMTQQRANDLVKALKTSIEDLSKNTFSEDAYVPVEDNWSWHGARAFSFLKRLNNNLTSDYPTDKYALYVYVVNSLVKKPEIQSNLSDFLKNILPSQNESIEKDNEFERALIEILAAVDDPRVREATIALLETTPSKDEQWIEKEYEGMSFFSLAIKRGNLGLVKFLLESYKLINAAVNKPDKNNKMPLIAAVLEGKTEIIQLLLDYGADVNTSDGLLTPLLVAVIKENQEIIKLLLKNEKTKIDVNQKGKSGWTPLLTAVSDENMETIQLLLEHGADVNIAKDSGSTPLTVAVAGGNQEIIKLLLKNEKTKIDVNQKGRSGWTPLLTAVLHKNIETIQLLLEHGADVNIAADSGSTPLTVAVEGGNQEIIKLLLKNKKTKIDVNKKGIDGSPLFIAVLNENMETIQLLLEYGADVNIANYKGHTPLLIAVIQENAEIVENLLRRDGIEVSQLLLAKAICKGNLKIIELLLSSYKGDVNALLRTAIQAMQMEVVKQLLSHKEVNVNHGADGWSPLLSAVIGRDTEAIQLLLEHGADVNLVPEGANGWTPLEHAISTDNENIIDLLRVKLTNEDVENKLKRLFGDEKRQHGIEYLAKAHISNYKFTLSEGQPNELLQTQGEELLNKIKDSVKNNNNIDFNQLLIYTQLIHRAQTAITSPHNKNNLVEMYTLIQQAPGHRSVPKLIVGVAMIFIGAGLLIGSVLALLPTLSLSTPLSAFGISVSIKIIAAALIVIGGPLIHTGKQKDKSIASASYEFWKTANKLSDEYDQHTKEPYNQDRLCQREAIQKKNF